MWGENGGKEEKIKANFARKGGREALPEKEGHKTAGSVPRRGQEKEEEPTIFREGHVDLGEGVAGSSEGHPL